MEQTNLSILLLVDNSVTLSQPWKGLKRQRNDPATCQEKKTSDNYSQTRHLVLKYALQLAFDLYSNFSLIF